jgi:hypothetical protein
MLHGGMTSEDEILKALKIVTGFLVKEAVSKEHERIRMELDNFAEARGFTTRLDKLPNGLRPDVLRLSGGAGSTLLFLGDAKVPENENPERFERLLRVSRYLDAFARYLGEKRIVGGFLAIATNSEDSATQWVMPLTEAAVERGLTTAGGDAPSFRVMQAGNAWVAIW